MGELAHNNPKALYIFLILTTKLIVVAVPRTDKNIYQPYSTFTFSRAGLDFKSLFYVLIYYPQKKTYGARFNAKSVKYRFSHLIKIEGIS